MNFFQFILSQGPQCSLETLNMIALLDKRLWYKESTFLSSGTVNTGVKISHQFFFQGLDQLTNEEVNLNEKSNDSFRMQKKKSPNCEHKLTQ